jgi:hypothetical protein
VLVFAEKTLGWWSVCCHLCSLILSIRKVEQLTNSVCAKSCLILKLKSESKTMNMGSCVASARQKLCLLSFAFGFAPCLSWCWTPAAYSPSTEDGNGRVHSHEVGLKPELLSCLG